MLSSNSPTALTAELLSSGTYAGYNGGTGQDFWNLNRNSHQEQQPETLPCMRRGNPLLEKWKKESDRKRTKKQEWTDGQGLDEKRSGVVFVVLCVLRRYVFSLTARTWESSKPKES